MKWKYFAGMCNFRNIFIWWCFPALGQISSQSQRRKRLPNSNCVSLIAWTFPWTSINLKEPLLGCSCQGLPCWDMASLSSPGVESIHYMFHFAEVTSETFFFWCAHLKLGRQTVCGQGECSFFLLFVCFPLLYIASNMMLRDTSLECLLALPSAAWSTRPWAVLFLSPLHQVQEGLQQSILF